MEMLKNIKDKLGAAGKFAAEKKQRIADRVKNLERYKPGAAKALEVGGAIAGVGLLLSGQPIQGAIAYGVARRIGRKIYRPTKISAAQPERKESRLKTVGATLIGAPIGALLLGGLWFLQKQHEIFTKHILGGGLEKTIGDLIKI